MKENLVLKIHPEDNVLVALSNLKKEQIFPSVIPYTN